MSAVQPAEMETTTDLGGSRQYLTFMLAGEEYGVDILRVQEIRGWETPTPIPNTPAYIKGIVNLRGVIVPVIDLRQRFGMEHLEYGPTTVVIVINIEHEHGTRTIGLVVDAVSEVYSVEPEAVKPPPDFGTSVSTECIEGLANVDDKMVILLDIDRLIVTGVLNELAEE